MNKIDHDNEKGTIAPRAWRDVKAALQKMRLHLSALALLLEESAGDRSVRFSLAAALHHWLSLSEDGRAAGLRAYYKWDGKRPIAPRADADDGDRVAALERENRRLRAALDDDDAGEEWKAAEAPAPLPAAPPRPESLPEADRVSAADFNAACWRILAPAWPMPPGLPADATIANVPADGEPPMIQSGRRKAWRLHCPHCGRGYLDTAAYRRHLANKHARTPGGDGRAAA